MNNFFSGLIFSVLFFFILSLLEYITRKKNFNKEMTRRVAHVLSGLFAAVMGIVLRPEVFLTFAVFFFVIISISYGVKFFSSIHNVKRKTYGELLFPLGVVVAFLIADGSAAIYLASVIILALSDPLAGVIGDVVKRKNLYGSVAFFFSSLLILIIIFNLNALIIIVIIALMLTIVERVSSYGTDNLTIPLFCGLFLKFLL